MHFASILVAIAASSCASAAVYSDVQQLPADTFDFVVIGGMYNFWAIGVFWDADLEITIKADQQGTLSRRGLRKTHVAMSWLLKPVARTSIVDTHFAHALDILIVDG